MSDLWIIYCTVAVCYCLALFVRGLPYSSPTDGLLMFVAAVVIGALWLPIGLLTGLWYVLTKW